MIDDPRNPQPAVGTALALTGISSTQFGAAVATHLFLRVGPLGTVSLRLLGAAVALTLLARPWRRDWARAELGAAVLFGAVLTAMNATLYLALDRLPLATVVTLEFLGPLCVAVLTAASWVTRIWALPAAGGVVLIGGGLSAHDVLGVVFALSAACCWAAYILLSGRMGRTGTGLAGLGIGCVFGALVMLPVGAAAAGSDLLRPSTVAIGMAVGVLSSAIPYGLDLQTLRRLPTAVFGVMSSLNPGASAVAGYLVLGQTLSALTLVGVGLVMVATAGATVTPTVRARTAARRAASCPDDTEYAY